MITSCYNYYESLFDSDLTIFPKNVRFITKPERDSIFADKKQKIVITTSGMLSHGPAQTYIPLFLQKDTLIHLTGYAAEGTLARKLIDSYEEDLSEIEINGSIYPSNSTVKWTNEFSSHATAPELIKFLKQFKNLRFVIVNHGEEEIKERFKNRIQRELPVNVEVINRSKLYVVGSYGLIKSMNTKKLIAKDEHSKKDRCKGQYCPNKHPILVRTRR